MLNNKLIMIIIIILSLGLAGCYKTDKIQLNPIPTVATGSVLHGIQVEFNEREYNEINVAEIPSFVGTAKDLEAMNQAVATATDEFMAAVPKDGAIQIISNPVTTDRYVQVVTHYLAHQGGDNVGNVISVNYDIKADDYITLDEIIATGASDMVSIIDNVTNLYRSTSDGEVVTDAEVVAFFINEADGKEVIELYLKMYIENSAGESWAGLFSYVQDSDSLKPVDLQMIVDPLIVDQYEPELISNRIAQELINSGAATDDGNNTGILIANFLNGRSNFSSEFLQKYEFSYSGDLTIEKLAQGLTAVTGLDFYINSATINGDSAYVDWSMTSTLLAGLDDRPFKEEFTFYDNVTLNWFMLDSLNTSIIENFNVSNVYYSMNNGEDLIVPEMPPLAIFSTDIPYISSTFYYAHGTELDTVDFTITKGTWRLDGDETAAYFVMDGTGLVDAYYASGSHEYSARLEQGYGGLSGLIVFEIYNNDNEMINDMWFDGQDQFYLGGTNNNLIFIKD